MDPKIWDSRAWVKKVPESSYKESDKAWFHLSQGLLPCTKCFARTASWENVAVNKELYACHTQPFSTNSGSFELTHRSGTSLKIRTSLVAMARTWKERPRLGAKETSCTGSVTVISVSAFAYFLEKKKNTERRHIQDYFNLL